MPDDQDKPTPPTQTPPVKDPRESIHNATDYAGGNSHRQREAQTGPAPEPKNKSVVKNEVIVKKQTTGQRFRTWVSLLDFGSVSRWLYKELLIPEAKRIAYRAVSEGGERIIFRNDTINRRNLGSGPVVRHHTVYQTPVGGGRPNPYPVDPRRPQAIEARSFIRGASRNNYITQTHDEAEDALRQMYDNLQTYEQVSVGDLLQILGLPTDFPDFKWGWYELGRVRIRQVPQGWQIELPPPEQL